MAELALRLEGVSPQFGKTVLQKLVYILQEVYGVPCGYNYILYNYGPYSDALADDLDFFASMDGVKVHFSGLGYDIKESDKTTHFRDKGQSFLAEYAQQINDVIEAFGHMSAKELELRSTIFYVAKEQPLDKQALLERVKGVKPHFSENEIQSAYASCERFLS